MRAEAEHLASKFPPLRLAARRLAATVRQGAHGRRRSGAGEAFWQFRPYQSFDTALAVDWRQSAKRGQVYVRQREWQTAQTVWLWRNGSASMAYASAPALPTKQARADLLVLALASLLAAGDELTIRVIGDAATDLSLHRLDEEGNSSGEVASGRIIDETRDDPPRSIHELRFTADQVLGFYALQVRGPAARRAPYRFEVTVR